MARSSARTGLSWFQNCNSWIGRLCRGSSRFGCRGKHPWPLVEHSEDKTAPAPPAVRAPVFPHSLPVTEGLKVTIRLAVGWGAAA